MINACKQIQQQQGKTEEPFKHGLCTYSLSFSTYQWWAFQLRHFCTLFLLQVIIQLALLT